MFNDWLTIGGLTIHGYGVMIAVGILTAVWLAEKQTAKYGLDSTKVDGLAITAVVVGYIFSKLTYILTVIPEFIKDPLSVLGSSGWVVYGGILGGLLGAYLYCKKQKMDFFAYFNVIMPCVPLAQAFGRIGCFFAGCCYGKPTNGAWGITFPQGSLCPIHEPLIPTQLISSLGDFIIFMLLMKICSNEKTRNTTGAWYMILYSIGRFGIEFLRGDVERGNVGIFSTSQFIALFTCFAGIILYVYAKKKKENKTI